MTQFTEKIVKVLKPEKKRRIVWSERAGFGLRISVKGKKSWVYQYRLDGRERLLTLGEWPRMSLSDARQALEAASDAKDHGTDPADAHKAAQAAERAAMPIAVLMQEYIELWAKPHNRSWKESQRMLNVYVIPKWGGRKAKDIKRRDVIELLDAIVARGAPIQANRVFSVVRRAFKFAVERDMLQASPCAFVRPPSPEKRKTHVLASPDIKLLWSGLGRRMTATFEHRRMTATTAAVLKIILVTGQRPGEVAGMHTSEFDAEMQWWTIPEERAKNKRSHRVPLTDLAREIILAEIGTRAQPCFVFASTHKPGCPVTRHGIAAAMRRNCEGMGIPHTTPHDLRRTFATEGGAIGIPRDHRKRILNHTDGDVTAIYDHYGYDDEKRAALVAWGAHILELTSDKGDGDA